MNGLRRLDAQPAATPDPRLAMVRRALAARAAAPVDRRERDAVARFSAALERLPRPFDTAADPVHVTASAIVLGPRGVLLHRHKRLGLWLQPGGHLEPDEWPAAAAVRETREETGLSAAPPDGAARVVHVDTHEVPAVGHTHLDLRYLLHAEGDPAPAASESQVCTWFPPAAALAVADPGLAGALRVLLTECDW